MEDVVSIQYISYCEKIMQREAFNFENIQYILVLKKYIFHYVHTLFIIFFFFFTEIF